MKDLLSKLEIPHKEIRVFGSQIMITCFSVTAAEKFAETINKFATVRSIASGKDETKDLHGNYTYSDVIRLWAVI